MPNKRKLFFELPFIIIAAVLLLGYVVMLLWNYVLPAALHAQRINYGQAVALFMLCRILFFGFRRRYNGKPEMWRNRGAQWRQKWMNMNDEERMKFRNEWKKRCHPLQRKQDE